MFSQKKAHKFKTFFRENPNYSMFPKKRSSRVLRMSALLFQSSAEYFSVIFSRVVCHDDWFFA